MRRSYEKTDDGILLRLDVTVYARQAVMRALYRLQERCAISYERNGAWLNVYLEPLGGSTNAEELAASAWREINFEMMRYDAVRESANVRELLLGRALYASCVEASNAPEPPEEAEESWREDRRRIFESWSAIPE